MMNTYYPKATGPCFKVLSCFAGPSLGVSYRPRIQCKGPSQGGASDTSLIGELFFQQHRGAYAWQNKSPSQPAWF